jgi:hypothetical protein
MQHKLKVVAKNVSQKQKSKGESNPLHLLKKNNIMKDKLQTIALGIFTLALLFTYVFNLLIRIV